MSVEPNKNEQIFREFQKNSLALKVYVDHYCSSNQKEKFYSDMKGLTDKYSKKLRVRLTRELRKK